MTHDDIDSKCPSAVTFSLMDFVDTCHVERNISCFLLFYLGCLGFTE